MPKRKSRRRHSHEPHPLKRFFIGAGVFLVCVLVLAGFWLLAKTGPQDVDYRDSDLSSGISEEAAAFQQASLELEAEFEDVLAIRPPGPEDLALLREALEKQRAYLDATRGVDSGAVERGRSLEARYQELASVELQEASLALEKEAIRLAEEDDYDAARATYLEAYKKQRTINERFPKSSAYSVGRATQLQRRARHLEAEPILQRSLELEKEAEAFIDAREWEQAAAKLQQAIDLQDRLNREFTDSNQASVARFEGLRRKREGIRSGRDYVEIEEVTALADRHRSEGQHLEAADLYSKAAQLQRELNKAYRDSPYASSERVAEFQRKAETAQSYELGLSIENNQRLLREVLAKRQTYEAAEIIVKLRRLIKQLREAYPRSSLNDEALELKVRYLNLVQNELEFIQDRVYASLLPIPEEKDWKILRNETTQALYSLIMGVNPSRNVGDTKPVDSVSWIEAKRFCERLSWILGKPVRLPTENEFRQSLGPLRYVVLEEHVWSASDAGGGAQPVAQKEPFKSGCYDLLGNVSEWLESVDRFETENARHIGGHAQDPLEILFTVPVREAGRGERNRLIGFRFVVETD
ncbi:MAG: SUMF1/EgtB/PvdO family nonheme iron enzyme [Opitutales bacterium]